jgi:hypothetical protein
MSAVKKPPADLIAAEKEARLKTMLKLRFRIEHIGDQFHFIEDSAGKTLGVYSSLAELRQKREIRTPLEELAAALDGADEAFS